MSNAFSHPGFSQLSGVAPEAEMAAFDQLPREYRDFLNYAPADFSAIKTLSDCLKYRRYPLLSIYKQQCVETFGFYRA